MKGKWYVTLDKKTSQSVFSEYETTVVAKISDLEAIAQETNKEAYIQEDRYDNYIEVDGTFVSVVSREQVYFKGEFRKLKEMIRDKVEEKIKEIAIKNKTKEVELSIRKIVRDAYKEFCKMKNDKKRLDEQYSKFQKSKSFDLYNKYYHKYLTEEEQKEYEQLLNRLKTQVMSDNELNKVIKRLEELYEIAKENEQKREIEEKIRKCERIEKELRELQEKYYTLVELVKQNFSEEDILQFFRNEHDEKIEEQVREEYPELFD